MTEVRSGAPNALVTCPNCGETSPAGDRYCRSCGQPIDPSVISKPSGGRVQDDPWGAIVRRLRALVGNEFQIARELGRGGMAAVYLAYETALDRNVAMKIMSPTLLTGPGMIERFQREARTVAKLVHPNIVGIHAVRQLEDLHFFTMQFVEGRSLDRVIHDAGPLPIRTVRSLLYTIGTALGYAHRRGVVHRDVKPANILINEEGSAVVTDFGIAKVAQDSTVTGPNTQTNALVGTPAYISPEQCYGHPATEASDQYALGILAFELLTGHVPFSGTPFVVLQAHTEKAVPSIRARRADCPPELEVAVMRMLEKNPANRWQTMQHAMAELGAAPLPEGDPEQIALARLAVPEGTERVPNSGFTPPRLRDEGRGERAVTPQPAPHVAAVAILAPPESIEVGDSITLVAAARNASGASMPGARIAWTVDNGAVASVDEARGEVRALSAGEANVTATAGGVSKSVRVVVTPRKVATVQISLPPGSLRVGDSVRLAAKAVDKAQAPVPEGIHWMSGNSAIAEVTDDGVLVARNAGVAMVWAEAQGVRGSARVEIHPAPVAAIQIVTPPEIEEGERFQLRATALGAHGEVLTDRPFSWKSSDPKIAVVSLSGEIEARAPGRAKIVCSCEGREATVNVVVGAPATARVVITKPATRPVAGDSVRLEAQAYSRQDLPIERKFRWGVSPSNLAKVSKNGQVTTLAPGTLTVVASTDDGEASIVFDIESRPGAVLPPLVAPDRAPVALEGSSRPSEYVPASEPTRRRPALLAIGVGAVAVLGIVVAMIVRGSSSAAGSGGEKDTTTKSGKDSVVAVVDSVPKPRKDSISTPVKDSASNPSGIPFAKTITVRGVPSRVAVDDVYTLTADARDAGGKEIKPSSLRWISKTPAIATIDRKTGRLVAKSKGRATITVDADSAHGMVLIDVNDAVRQTVGDRPPPPARTIKVSPTDSSISVGETMSLSALRSGPGASSSVTWESDQPSVATVDAQGRVSGVAPGTATISAKWEEMHASARIVVRAIAVASVSVTAPSGSITEGQQIQLRATLADSRNNPLSGRDVTWRSENPDLASVSPTGLVTAIRAGNASIVAASEGRSGRVVVQIASRAVTKVDGGSPPAAPPVDKTIDDFVRTLNGHNETDIRRMVDVATWEQFQSKIKNFGSLRAQPSTRATTQISEQATVDFRVVMHWTNAVGKGRDVIGQFRATFALSNNAWVLQRITLLNQLE